MKNKTFVRKAMLSLGVGALLAGSGATTSSIANASVSATAVTNGPIHYSYGAEVLYKTLNTDGSAGSNPSFAGGLPHYSADGTKVAWIEVEMGARPNYTVYSADSDGSNMKKLATTDSKRLTKPQFSADKSKLLLLNTDNNEIYQISSTTENQTIGSSIFSNPIARGFRDYSVSANDKIAHVQSTRDVDTGNDPAQCNGNAYIAVSDLDGSNTTRVASTCTDRRLTSVQWNSDGTSLIIGQTITATTTHQLAGLALDGTITPYATTSAAVTGIALSPDRTQLAFATTTFSMSISMSVKTMNADGSGSPTDVAETSDPFAFLSWGIPANGASTGGGSNTGNTTDTPTNNTTTNTTVVPGVTVTDTKVYTVAPKEVAADSAVTVMTRQESRTQSIVSNTPAVCLPTKDAIVFIDEGRCNASILDKKTGEVLRRFRTTVVEDSVSELKIGNEIATIAPIFFDGGSSDVNDKGMKRIRNLRSRITAAGNVLVVGHSGIALGDTPENRELSRQRAISTVNAMKKVGAKGPFVSIGVGSKDPLVNSTSGKDQSKNCRVVIILVP
jgi:outer membrane protein OmpA-like peptidoglycan-associated protein